MTDQDAERGGTHRIVGRGSDVAIEVDGPTVEACLAAAVEGFAAALGTVEPDTQRRRREITVPGDSPGDLLVGLVDEAILLLDAEGLVTVALTEPRVDEDGLHATVDVVALDTVHVHGAGPKAATWHGARLTRLGDHWTGHVMLDL